MTDITYNQTMPEQNFRATSTNSAEINAAKAVSSHQKKQPQEVHFEKVAMRTLLVCAFFAFAVLISVAFILDNHFALKIMAVEAALIIAVVFIVNKFS